MQRDDLIYIDGHDDLHVILIISMLLNRRALVSIIAMSMQLTKLYIFVEYTCMHVHSI
jgi:hypothetical protein